MTQSLDFKGLALGAGLSIAAGGIMLSVALYLVVLSWEPGALQPGPTDAFYGASDAQKVFFFVLYTFPVGALVSAFFYAVFRSLSWVLISRS